MTYKFFIGLKDNSEVLQLPVNPPELKISLGGSSKTYNIVEFGDVVIPNNRTLITTSISSFFPLNYAPYVEVSEEELMEPRYYADRIFEWKENKEILRLVVSGSDYPINILCILENTEIIEKGGEVGDLYYNITLKEYREVKANEVVLINQGNKVKFVKQGTKARPATIQIPSIYVIREADTLWAIAKKYLNDGSRYHEIASLNNINNPNMILVGQQIKLPEVILA